VFIFDTNILSKLPEKDARIQFIYRQIAKLKAAYRKCGSDLLVFFDKPINAHQYLHSVYEVKHIFYNRDYEPYAQERDETINQFWKSNGVRVFHYKDHILFEAGEVLKYDGKTYTVFTPYSKKLKTIFQNNVAYPSEQNTHKLFQIETIQTIPSLKSMDFAEQEINFPEKTVEDELISKYDTKRDYPGINGTSRLGIHLRFGTLSVRQLAKRAANLNQTFLNELIWRDFY